MLGTPTSANAAATPSDDQTSLFLQAKSRGQRRVQQAYVARRAAARQTATRRDKRAKRSPDEASDTSAPAAAPAPAIEARQEPVWQFVPAEAPSCWLIVQGPTEPRAHLGAPKDGARLHGFVEANSGHMSLVADLREPTLEQVQQQLERLAAACAEQDAVAVVAFAGSGNANGDWRLGQGVLKIDELLRLLPRPAVILTPCGGRWLVHKSLRSSQAQLTIVSATDRDGRAAETHGTPSNGGRFFSALLGARTPAGDCRACRFTQHRRRSTHKTFSKQSICEQKDLPFCAVQDGVMLEWDAATASFVRRGEY